jgi:hypothetical protein
VVGREEKEAAVVVEDALAAAATAECFGNPFRRYGSGFD